MIAALAFDYPMAWLGLPLAVMVLAFWAWAQSRRGLVRGRLLSLLSLRAVALFALVFLAAKPVWVAKPPPLAADRPVVVLFDRSESMSIEEGDSTRFDQAMKFARQHLFPALASAKLPVTPLLFAQDAEIADNAKLSGAKPDGKRTNLGSAIARALPSSAAPPLAVIALTDGIVNENAENVRALSALVEAGVPFIGVGFGSDVGSRTLSLRQVDAPPVVAPSMTFNISAQLEMTGSEEMAPFDLLLFRDGAMREKKTINAGKGSRYWLESFRVTEAEQGTHSYTVQLMPPNSPGLKVVNNLGSATVRITNEKELRVLYVQGALTWDYKFVGLALHGDQSIKLTGLTRTSKQSVFRQNVESSTELTQGFPTTIEELAPFRVVVLSNLKPSELQPTQQELLARFCSELGGGVLVIGGPATFDASWRGSRLEQVLPVTFAASQGVIGLDKPFRMKLTEEAFQNPIFQIADNRPLREVWAGLPAFTQYGRVDSAKPGAQVWAEHADDLGPQGRRILMASQRYGAGLAAVISVQNFWRWRLAQDAEPQQFDRFWRQLFRYLGEVGRQDVSIHLTDQDLHPQMDVRVVLEKQPNPKSLTEKSSRFQVRVENEKKKILVEQTVELTPARPVDLTWRAEDAGVYQITVLDAQKATVVSRAVEIRDVNVEFQNTGRDMETLRQWAALTDGLAVKVEDCRDSSGLVAQIKAKVQEIRDSKPHRRPMGVNGWMLAAVLACLGGDWILRKRWGLG